MDLMASDDGIDCLAQAGDQVRRVLRAEGGTGQPQVGTGEREIGPDVPSQEDVELVASGKVNARSVMNASKVVATRGALEKLQEVLA